jgi:hypothetical protein
MDEKYTFEDWQQGKIAQDYRKGKIALDVKEGTKRINSCKPGMLPLILYHHGLLSERDYQKIRNAQKKTFFIAVDFTERTLTERFKEKLSKAPNPKKLLDFKIKELRKIINNAPPHIQEAVYSKDWDESGIDLYKYLQIMDPYDFYSEGSINNCSVIIHLSKPSEVPSDAKNTRSIQSYYKLGPKILKSPMFKCGYLEYPPPPPSELEKNVQNEVYDLTVTYRYLERLKQLQNSSQENSKTKDTTCKDKLPDPYQVAREFKKQSKNKNTPYTIDDYAFVMKFARDNPNETFVTNLIKKITNHPNCPDKIRMKKDRKAERRWIDFYDTSAGIERK